MHPADRKTLWKVVICFAAAAVVLLVLRSITWAEIAMIIALICGVIATLSEVFSRTSNKEPPVTQDRDEYCTVDVAAAYLDVTKEKIKRLIAEGEIRAFREGNGMKLLCRDIEKLIKKPK